MPPGVRPCPHEARWGISRRFCQALVQCAVVYCPDLRCRYLRQIPLPEVSQLESCSVGCGSNKKEECDAADDQTYVETDSDCRRRSGDQTFGFFGRRETGICAGDCE